MTVKTGAKSIDDQDLKNELKEIKSWKSKEPKENRLIEIAKHFAKKRQWNMALDAVQLISHERERNLLIADLIEGDLLPSHEIDEAKKFAKYLTPVVELESLVWIRIALADSDLDQARVIAERLPSPLSRNFAYMHIMESYLEGKEKNKIKELLTLMLENIKTIYDNKSRCYILRELALNLFLAHKDKETAQEIAILIPDEKMRREVLNKIQ